VSLRFEFSDEYTKGHSTFCVLTIAQVSIRFLSHPPSPRRIRLTQHSVCLVESEYYTDIVSVPESSDDMCELVSVFMDTYMSACSLGGDIYVCTNRFRIITFTLMDQWNLCIV
jgi:hypothetical protein